jgi:hypothetical protein
MSLKGLCTSGPNRGKSVKMDAFSIVNYKSNGRNRYFARGESTSCKNPIMRVVSKDFAMDWEKSTGKKIKVQAPSVKKQKENEAKKKRKAERKLKKKEQEKAKKLREKERAKKKKENSKKKSVKKKPTAKKATKKKVTKKK